MGIKRIEFCTTQYLCLLAGLASSTLGCSNPSAGNPSAATPSAVAPGLTGERPQDDWTIQVVKNPVSEIEHVRLAKTLTSIDDGGLQVTARLNCDTLGFMSSEIESNSATMIWQQSPNDLISQGFMRAAGIRTNPLSTSVQWRVGNNKHQGYVSLGKFNNVVQITRFLDLASEAWGGTLAIVLDSDHGRVGEVSNSFSHNVAEL